MKKPKKKLTTAQKRARKQAKMERQKKYQWVFMNGKQVRIKKPPTIDGIPVDDFIRQNADPIWLHQNEMWEYMDETLDPVRSAPNTPREEIETPKKVEADLDDDIPF